MAKLGVGTRLNIYAQWCQILVALVGRTGGAEYARQPTKIDINLFDFVCSFQTHTHTHPPPLAVENPENGVKNVSNIQRVFPPRARASIGEVV